jgi:TRAP-type C4-dicarboxylate transport system permease small subunit
MMGCGLCAREGSLISLSLVYDLVSQKAKKIMVAIITVVNSSFWLLLLFTGIKKVMTQMANGKRTPSLMVPEWMFTIFLPIGCIFLLLHTIEYCMDFLSKKEEADA